MKIFKSITAILYILILLCSILIQLWSQAVGYGFSLSSWIYWIILGGLIFLAWEYKYQSLIFLTIGFLLFILGILFTIVQFDQTAETIFRVSFIFWIVGITKALFEYRKRLI